MKTVYIHIGTPKTGTTAIQQFLRKNKDALSAQNAVYPDFDVSYDGIGSARNGHWLATNVRDRETSAACFKKINDLAGDYDTIILSDEGLWNAGSSSKAFWREIKENISVSVKAIVYVRRQDDYIVSYWAQKVKEGTESRSLTEYVAALPWSKLDYSTRLKSALEVLGRENVIVRSYDEVKAGLLLHDFFGSVGLEYPEEVVIKKEYINTSIAGNVLEARRLLNKTPGILENENLLQRYVKSAQQKMQEEGSFCERDIFPGRKDFLKQYEKSNRELAREFFGREEMFDEKTAEKGSTGEIGEGSNSPVGRDDGSSPYTDEEISAAFGYMIREILSAEMEEQERLREEQKRLRSSYSFRLGRSLMGPAIYIKRKLRGKQKAETEEDSLPQP